MRAIPIVLAALFWLGYGWCAYIITLNSLPYFEDYGRWSLFMVEKGEVADIPWYFPALKLHVVGGMICLFIVALQFFPAVLKRLPKLHRWAGRIYGLSVLFLLGIPGMPMSIYAKGGFLGQIGFLTLGALTLWTTWVGIKTARQKKFKAHREWMIRSFALVASAITFRLLQIGLYYGFPSLTDSQIYVTCLYLSTFGNLAIAEFYIARTRKRRTKTSHEKEYAPNTDNNHWSRLGAIAAVLFSRGRRTDEAKGETQS